MAAEARKIKCRLHLAPEISDTRLLNCPNLVSNPFSIATSRRRRWLACCSCLRGDQAAVRLAYAAAAEDADCLAALRGAAGDSRAAAADLDHDGAHSAAEHAAGTARHEPQHIRPVRSIIASPFEERDCRSESEVLIAIKKPTVPKIVISRQEVTTRNFFLIELNLKILMPPPSRSKQVVSDGNKRDYGSQS